MSLIRLRFIVQFVAVVLLSGCPQGGEPTPDDSLCEACLESGGTWQPEASGCTQDCAIQDISCFTTECPDSCTDDCSDCFSQDECEDAGCTWNQEAEAMWCTTP